MKRLNIIRILLPIFFSACSIFASDRTLLRLGILLDSNNTQSIDYAKTITSVISNVNSQRDILPSAVLEPVIILSESDPHSVLSKLCEDIIPRDVFVLLSYAATYGPWLVSSVTGIPLITLGTQSEIQESKAVNMLRLEVPSYYQSYAILSTLKHKKWWRLSLIVENTTEGLHFVKHFQYILNSTQSQISVERIIYIPENCRNSPNIQSLLRPYATRRFQVFVVHATLIASKNLFILAHRLGLTTNRHFWLLTEEAFSRELNDLVFLPHQVLGIHNSNKFDRIELWDDTINIIVQALRKMYLNDVDLRMLTQLNISCWKTEINLDNVHKIFYRYLLKTFFHGKSGFISFNSSGIINLPRYQIWQLRKRYVSYPNQLKEQNYWKRWISVGYWEDNELFMNDKIFSESDMDSVLYQKLKSNKITLRVATLEQQPYMFVTPLAPTSECVGGSICLKPMSSQKESIKNLFRDYHQQLEAGFINNLTIQRYCCYGICQELLERISEDLDLNFDLYLTSENQYGWKKNGTWNGLIGEILNGGADLVIAPLSVNEKRSQVVEFTTPFSYSGIALVIVKSNSLIRIGAFLEPLNWTMWLGIFVALHTVALAATFYEWHSPYGLTPRGRNRREVFSFPSALTLCWSILLSHTVATKSPKCWSSRFLLNVWAGFSLIFLASYTANLAAFMVGEKTLVRITNFDDEEIQNPSFGFKVGTVMDCSADIYIKKNYPILYPHIRKNNVKTFEEGIENLKSGKINGFLFDRTILEYILETDTSGTLDLIEKDIARDSYGVALPKKSPLTNEISSRIVHYINTGVMEEAYRRWKGTAGCKQRSRPKSIALSTDTFTGVFLLFSVGIFLGIATLFFEHFVYHCCVPHLQKWRFKGWLPISQRLHCVVNSDGFIVKNIYTQKRRSIALRAVAERIIEASRRYNGDPIFDFNMTGTRIDQYSLPLLSNSQNNQRKLSVRSCLSIPEKCFTNSSVQTDFVDKTTTDEDSSRCSSPNPMQETSDQNVIRRLHQIEEEVCLLETSLAVALHEKEELLEKLAEYEGNEIHRPTQKIADVPTWEAAARSAHKEFVI